MKGILEVGQYVLGVMIQICVVLYNSIVLLKEVNIKKNVFIDYGK